MSLLALQFHRVMLLGQELGDGNVCVSLKGLFATGECDITPCFRCGGQERHQ